MAKSLRSKSKLAARNAKRYNRESDYAVVHAARLHVTASKLAEKNKHGKKVAEEDADGRDAALGDATMGDCERTKPTAAGDDDPVANG